MSERRWIDERLHHPSVAQRLLAERVLFEQKGGLQNMLIFENPVFGRTLLLDGAVQTTERDEFVYHEMLAHVPLFAHPAPRRALVIGGGDGGTLEEVLKHRLVDDATLVEIDAAVIEASREHLRSIGKDAFEDERATIVVGDGLSFVRDGANRFDVIIVDSTDPQGPGRSLFTREFYAHCHNRLTRGGILVAQSGIPFLQPDEIRTVAAGLREVFTDVGAYTASVPSYYGGSMVFVFASDNPANRGVSAAELGRRFAETDVTTRYYLPDVHLAAFVLPRFVRDLMVPS